MDLFLNRNLFNNFQAIPFRYFQRRSKVSNAKIVQILGSLQHESCAMRAALCTVYSRSTATVRHRHSGILQDQTGTAGHGMVQH
jgi:hypothetical protein